MQNNGSYCEKKAPLAFLESFESRIEDNNSEMNEFWSNDTRDFVEPHQTWYSQEFSDITRKQQNYKMYKV